MEKDPTPTPDGDAETGTPNEECEAEKQTKIISGTTKEENEAEQRQTNIESLFYVVTRDVSVGCLVVVFAYTIYVQSNDTSGVELWSLFYALHCALCAVALASYHVDAIGSKSKVVLFPISAVMVVWSLVQIIPVSIQYHKEEEGGEVDGGDNPGITNRQEIMYELCGTIFGLLVASFHAFYFYRRGQPDENPLPNAILKTKFKNIRGSASSGAM